MCVYWCMLCVCLIVAIHTMLPQKQTKFVVLCGMEKNVTQPTICPLHSAMSIYTLIFCSYLSLSLASQLLIKTVPIHEKKNNNYWGKLTKNGFSAFAYSRQLSVFAHTLCSNSSWYVNTCVCHPLSLY